MKKETEELAELEDIIFEITNKPHGEVEKSFTVDSDDKAAWAAKKVLEAQKRIEARNQLAATYKARIDVWFEKATKQDRSSVAFLRSLLLPFAHTALSQVRKGRTLYFPGVSISLRKLPDKAEILDEQLALSFCEKNLAEAIEVKRSIVKSVIKRELSGGALIPGVELTQGIDELYISSDERDGEVGHEAA